MAAELEMRDGRSYLAVMDPDEGDIRTYWNRNNLAEVEEARAAFDRAKARGMLVYKLDKSDQRGEVIREFDPAAERIVAVPRHVGG